MRKASLLVPCLATLATTLAGQFVSPSPAATVEGSSSQQVPFNSSTARRHMQLHSDVPSSTSPIITRLSFRQNGGNTVNFTGTRSIDLELYMSNSSVRFDRLSTLFASNHSQPPTTAIARRIVNFGPQGPNSSPGPAAFAGMDLVLDAPFLYTVGATLVWEAAVFANTLTGSFNALDADQGSLTNATFTSSGLGCIATGRTLRMIQGVACQDMAGTLLYGVSLASAPANSTAILALGTQNPNLVVPGLCSNLYTDLALVVPLGTTDANGLISADAGIGFVIDNTFTGTTLYCQSHVLDTGRPDAIKVCNSDGVATTMPASNLTKRLQVARLLNNVGGANATRATFAADTMVGYGLVVRFQ